MGASEVTGFCDCQSATGAPRRPGQLSTRWSTPNHVRGLRKPKPRTAWHVQRFAVAPARGDRQHGGVAKSLRFEKAGPVTANRAQHREMDRGRGGSIRPLMSPASQAGPSLPTLASMPGARPALGWSMHTCQRARGCYGFLALKRTPRSRPARQCDDVRTPPIWGQRCATIRLSRPPED